MSSGEQMFPLQLMQRIVASANGGTAIHDDSFRVTPQASFRGETRVWRVDAKSGEAHWYVKRVDDDRLFRRYVAGAELLSREAGRGGLVPLQIAAADRERLAVATVGVTGTIAAERLVAGARFDRLLDWPRADLPGLAEEAASALHAAWQIRGAGTDECFEDCRPPACATRIEEKFARLANVGNYRRHAVGIDRACAALRRLDSPEALLIGDVDFANMLLTERGVCFFDLDDLSIGDPARDIACLLHRLSRVRRNWKYASWRVAAVADRLATRTRDNLSGARLGLYQVEFVLDALWSAHRYAEDPSLPVHGESLRQLETELSGLLEAAGR